jgi:ubiquinol-cytochrome c reductase iron-sulfur subunit
VVCPLVVGHVRQTIAQTRACWQDRPGSGPGEIIFEETDVSETQMEHEGTRRDFLYVATAATGAVVAGAAVWPLVDQMNPSADVLALASIRVDISGLEEGSQMSVLWRGKPVFIRNRTAEEIEAARAVPMSDLKDPVARNDNVSGQVPATDENRTVGGQEKIIVMMGVCTHLGCVPLGDGAGDFGGWFCPCHGSHYDTAGRIRKGPAPRNLPVPVAEFVDDTTIKLG